MTPPKSDEGKQKQSRLVRYTIIGILGQVGCLTILIVLGALFAGIWLDRYFNTNRSITFVLLIISLPLSLVVMYLVVRAGLARLTPYLNLKKDNHNHDEEADIGEENP